MGDHGGTWISNPHLGYHPLFIRSPPTVREDPSLVNLISGLTSHNINMSLKNGATLPANDSWCRFYSFPHFGPPFPLVSNSVGHGERGIASGVVPKRFLVVDQYKDQTTLMFSSGVGTAIKCLNSLSPEFPNSYLHFEEPGREKDSNWKVNAGLSSDLSKEEDLYSESEMHEDTEELNALLYSDEDESDYEEDEVTSTGHSPNKADELSFSLEEEVASSLGPTRKRKKSDKDEDGFIPFKVCNTSGTSKEGESFKQESITQDSEFEEVCSSSSNKRSRKEKIRETVSVLQSIIPGSHGKEAMAVLDEAIHYLRSLKLKAKTLGLNSH